MSRPQTQSTVHSQTGLETTCKIFPIQIRFKSSNCTPSTGHYFSYHLTKIPSKYIADYQSLSYGAQDWLSVSRAKSSIEVSSQQKGCDLVLEPSRLAEQATIMAVMAET